MTVNKKQGGISMKRLISLAFIFTFIISLSAETDFLSNKVSASPYSIMKANSSRDEENVIFEEDFEDGLGEWQTIDATAPDDWNENWHLSTEGAWEGHSWWMGDETLGGYTSHRYLVLDTPELSLPTGNPTLTFMVSWNVEELGGTGEYDGWDGSNVRISTDGGANWNVISGTPAYNGTSMYSFGYEFNEGPGIPGWGDTSNGWQDAEFDLSSYAGDEIKIRFAFASDPAYDTADDLSLFGLRIDDINIADIFYSDGDGAEGDDEMIPGYAGEISGNFWALDTTNPHSGTNAMRCTVQDYLENDLISPEIELPDLVDVDMYIDYWVYCDMLDADGDGDNSLEDLYHVYVKGLNDIAWTRLHYNFNGIDVGGVASVWTLIDEEYALNTFGWQSGTCDISDWAGETIQVKFKCITDGNDDGGVGTGLFIDDFRVYNTIFLGPAPENLTATTLPNNDVELTWDPAEIGGEEGWIGWDNGVLEGYLGLNAAGEWDVASRFTASDLMPYVGGEITTVKFMPGTSTSSSYSVRVWTGAAAGELVAEEDITNPIPTEWNEIDLSTPITIEAGEAMWIGYHINQVEPANPGGYSAGYDAGPSVAGLYINQGSGFSDLSGDFDYNWLIQGLVTAQDGMVYELPTPQTRELEGYHVWHTATEDPFEIIATVDVSNEPSYIHTDGVAGEFNHYVVTAIYDGYDSGFSNEASTYVLSNYEETLYYDDGEAEEGYNSGQGRHMAVKYSPAYDNGPVNVKLVQFYVENLNVGSMIFRIFDDNGEGGMPGADFITQFAVSGNIVAGWNTLMIPVSGQAEFADGDFYIGILEITSPSSIGLDTDTSGNSYTDASDSWEMITEGNLMIRAIVEDVNVGSNDTDIPENRISLSNYPNPFNPVTNISFSLPEAGETSLKVYNLKGQLVSVLLDTYLEAGEMNLIWDGTDLQGNSVTSGLYFYTLENNSKKISKKMILLK